MLIREKLEQGDFSNNERVVASYILEQKLNIKNMTVKEIAEATFTSSSALSRVAHKMNYKSWNAFKEAYLEEELYLESHFHEIDANYPFNRKDSFISIESKLARLYIETIEDTVTLNGYESLYQAVDIMQKTSGINLFGLSDNLLAAQQFQTKLLRIGKMSQVAAAVFEGSYLSRTCSIDSCAIVLSYTGETSELLKDAKCLKKRGIPVIAITSVGENSLSNLADCVLRICTREKLYSKIGNFSSLCSMNYMLDVLYSCYFSREYDQNLKIKLEVGHEAESCRRTTNTILLEDDPASKETL